VFVAVRRAPRSGNALSLATVHALRRVIEPGCELEQERARATDAVIFFRFR
jgi:hypothetical protein